MRPTVPPICLGRLGGSKYWVTVDLLTKMIIFCNNSNGHEIKSIELLITAHYLSVGIQPTSDEFPSRVQDEWNVKHEQVSEHSRVVELETVQKKFDHVEILNSSPNSSNSISTPNLSLHLT